MLHLFLTVSLWLKVSREIFFILKSVCDRKLKNTVDLPLKLCKYLQFDIYTLLYKKFIKIVGR